MVDQVTKDGCLKVVVEPDGVWLQDSDTGEAQLPPEGLFLGDSRAELLELSDMFKRAALELPEEES